jgi:aminoglycoside/choline kinase family phosphotransferase
MTRHQQLIQWLSNLYPSTDIKLVSVSGDASFRKYHRFNYTDGSLIVMDSAPELENNQSFIDVSNLLKRYNINVPTILHQDHVHGFFVISDFGHRLLLDEINTNNADHFYNLAIQEIVKIQAVDTQSLPVYDSELLLREMQLFTDWYLCKHKRADLSMEMKTVLVDAFHFLEKNALEQPQVFVHRDFHSRNLMVVNDETLGIIDYQDAVMGPVTYDLVSLLRDCYIDWPQHMITQWQQLFLDNLPESEQIDLTQLTRWFDLMGAQRHLKAIGIFCRLNYRDNKAAYLDDIPRTMNYLVQVCSQYKELQKLHQLLLRLG